MAKIGIGTFTHFDLTREDTLRGSVLNLDQRQLLQNDLAQIADSRLNLDYDPESPLKFTQNEAFLKGQMSIIRVMLLRSDESELQLQNLHHQTLGE